MKIKDFQQVYIHCTVCNFIYDKILAPYSIITNKILRPCVLQRIIGKKNSVSISILIYNNYSGNGYFEYSPGLIFPTLEIS